MSEHNAENRALTAPAEWARIAPLPLRELVLMRCPTCDFDIEDHTPGDLSGCMKSAQEDHDNG